MAKLARDELMSCCSSEQFVQRLLAAGPYTSVQQLTDAARAVWWHEVGVEGWLEAFAAHPRIGDVASLKAKFGAFASHSKSEQATALTTEDDTVYQELADWNHRYEAKFGHIFIVCASGKTAQEMLDILTNRYLNSPYQELALAAAEQMKITELRLRKVFEGLATQPAARAERRTGSSGRSPITTHVLDATLGVPARGLPIILHRMSPGSNGIWEAISRGSTNEDGRVPDLLPAHSLTEGRYKMWFDTGSYLRSCHAAHPAVFAAEPFYPEASVEFAITAAMVDQHFHIPLLLSPYSYSTYRGS